MGKRVFDLAIVVVLAFIVALVAARGFGGVAPAPGGSAKGTTNFDAISLDSSLAAGTFVDAATYVDAGSYVQAATYVDANTYMDAGTYIVAGTNITATAGSLATGTYVSAGSYVQAATYVDANTYMDAGTYIVAGTDITATAGSVAAGTFVDAATYVDAGSYVKAGTFARAAKQGDVTVTAGSTITPTGTYQPITASGEVTTSTTVAIAAGTSGDLVILVNVGSNAITVDNGGGTVLAGGADGALGANDSMTLVFDGTNWVQIGASNN